MACLLFVALTIVSTTSVAVASEFHRIRTPREIDNLAIARAVSADGRVAIGYINDPYRAPGFYWTAEDGSQRLPAPAPYTGNQIRGMSGDGTVFAGNVLADHLPTVAYRWTQQAGYELLGIPEGYETSSASFITADGQTVVGSSSGGENGTGRWTWNSADKFEFIPGDYGTPQYLSSDGSEIVFLKGIYSRAAGFTPNPENLISIFEVSSDASAMTGIMAFGNDNARQAARWIRGQEVEPLGVLEQYGHKRSRPSGISSDGEIVLGNSRINLDGFKDLRAFVWDAHHGMRELEDILRTEYGMVRPHPWGLSNATDISDDKRTIVGSSRNNDNQAGSDGEMWVVQLDWPIGTIHGDLDLGGSLDLADIDELQMYVRTGQYDSQSDFNFDQVIDKRDVQFWVRELKQTYFGDADLDGVFGTQDLVTVFQAGEYEDDVSLNSTWATGDWNGDSEFDTNDLVVAFQDGAYEAIADTAANSVPEPSNLFLMILGFLGIARRTRLWHQADARFRPT